MFSKAKVGDEAPRPKKMIERIYYVRPHKRETLTGDKLELVKLEFVPQLKCGYERNDTILNSNYFHWVGPIQAVRVEVEDND